MKHTKLFVRGLTLSTLLIVVAFASASTALGQVRDLEPNNICASPQNFGAVNLPLVLTGSLDPTTQTFYIDFFKFNGDHGATVVVDI